MSEQAHTPGPWEVHLGYDNTGYPCFYIHGMSGDQKRDIPTLTANARLIAAAPELLAAAERSLSWLASYPGGNCAAMYEQMRAAVDKATVR